MRNQNRIHRAVDPMLTVGWISGLVLFGVLAANSSAQGQQTCDRILVQDSTLDNLVDPPGYTTGTLGTLGDVVRMGTGPQDMILIPGLGFGGEVFREFMASHSDQFRMFAVTLPGFSGTPAPPSPTQTTSFGEQTWTTGALRGIEDLIANEGIQRPIIVGHWLTGTQLAFRLAREHPEDVRGVIILAGSTRFVPTDTTRIPAQMPLEQRVAGIDHYMAPRWFRTVTRETWDDNNFLPGDYAVNPILGLRLWREAARPDLHVWVRYLCEFYAQDISLEFAELKVSTLILHPGLEGIFHEPGNNYIDAYCLKSWEGAEIANDRIRRITIPDSRVCLWLDQPERVNSAVAEFIEAIE